jgi:leader peptidase (prepilin peptidase) / N-methyltransferase
MTQTILEIQQMMPWYFPVVAFVFGACIGSFLNVCIYRIPAGKSIVRPGSHCACGKPIAWYDNIPIVSWFILRGHARCCGVPFSFRYPAVEALAGALFTACWFVAPTPIVALAWMLFTAILICATFIDLDTMTIPDRFSVGGMIVGVIISGLVPALHPTAHCVFASLVDAVLGAFVGTALVYWIMVIAEIVLKRPAMGEGDVKLMGAIGAFCGWQGAVFALFGGAILGTAAMLAWAITQLILGKGLNAGIPKEALHTEAQPNAVGAGNPASANAQAADAAQPAQMPAAGGDDEVPAGAVPFGPSLAAGALAYLLLAQHAVSAYFDQIEWLFWVK